jgi:polysaccharide export outer membrane protein
MKPYDRALFFLLALLVTTVSVLGQPATPRMGEGPAIIDQANPNYTLGPDDQITIKAPQVPELNDRTYRIGQGGALELPLVGTIQAGGLKVEALEALLLNKLKETIRNPQVTVIPVTTRNQPVYFVGLFRTPGVYPLTGNRTLLEMLGTVGGVTPNTARRITITRRSEYTAVPLPGGTVDPVRKTSSLEIGLADGAFAIRPEDDILLAPYDIVTADRAERVYVLGNVGQPRSIDLGERTALSLAQALAEAGGITALATKDRIRVLRNISGTDRRAEIAVDLKGILEGKKPDLFLQADDVVYVPQSKLAILSRSESGIGNYLPFLILGLIRR